MSTEVITVPDLGGAEEVEVIEISVAVGDQVEADQTLLVLESDKAMMEIPAPSAGKIIKFFVREEDKIEKEGDPLVEIEISADGESEDDTAVETGASVSADDAVEEAQAGAGAEAPDEAVEPEPAAKSESGVKPEPVAERDSSKESSNAAADEAQALAPPETPTTDATLDDSDKPGGEVYAGPAVRQLARELGVSLAGIAGSGPRGRVLKEDVQAYVKNAMHSQPASGAGPGAGAGIPPVPETDFSQFGDIEQIKLTRIAKLTAANMHRSWLNVPHVTQFDDADITDLESFRKSLVGEGEERGVKMTPVPIILKACALALERHPALNRSLLNDGEHTIQKHYYHIGMAVDTPRGLVVPVIRDVDKKGLWQLAEEVALMAARARDGKLTTNDMQGACFTVSSLGAIGGKGFTPIINAPEVAILGVSKAQVQPVWNGAEFAPRTLLPLSLSYDHKAVNGGDAGRFLTELVALLGDIRRLSL